MFVDLVCKVVECFVESGEYYIICDGKEYGVMVKVVVGGGVIMVVMVYIKFFIIGVYLLCFIEGLFVLINYVVSFFGIYFVYFMLVIK